MKLPELTKNLKSLGWQSFTDEVGDKYTHFHLSDRFVQIIYGLRKNGQDQQFDMTLSLSTDEFSKCCNEIYPNFGYAPLVRNRKGLRYNDSVIEDRHVKLASHDAIAWAREQDLSTALQEYANFATSSPGALPMWHLGALVILGDVAKLKSYQESFESGDRLGFVPYVTKDHIDRAVALVSQA